MNKNDLSRRKFLKISAASVVAVPVAGLGLSSTASAAPERLDPNSPDALAMQYTLSSPHADRSCKNCLMQNDPGAEWSTCSIFPNNLIYQDGWCTGHVPRG